MRLFEQQIFPRHEAYDLSGQVCESLLQFEDVWEAKHLNIETEIEDDIQIRSDAELLSLVWSNLISNAVKFTPEGGTVGVTLTADAQNVTVSVRDTGCGISPEVGKHIFGSGESWEYLLNLAVGCIVCLLTVVIGIYMLRRGNREIKSFQEKHNGE